MKLSDLYPYVLPHVIGMPQPLVDMFIRQAARSFFIGTNSWQVALDPITYQEGTVEYDLGLQASAELCKVVSVVSGDGDYTKAVKVLGDDTLAFEANAAPGNGADVDVTVALAPRVGDPAKAWSLPTDLDRFIPDIANGALALALATIKGRGGEAAAYMTMFASAINTQGIRESRKRSGRRVAVRDPSFM